jgi:hypothetical protein
MSTLDELRKSGLAVQQVIAERLGLDPHDLLDGSVSVEVDSIGGAEVVRWSGLRKMPSGFLGECLTEAVRREEAEGA